MLRIPNLLHESVPKGATEEDNLEVRRWGKPKAPAFELKGHAELAEALGIADFERGRKAAGAGFVYLLGDLARLDQALNEARGATSELRVLGRYVAASR